jgi:5-methylcytosine-specific restriction endonuclease McrA
MPDRSQGGRSQAKHVWLFRGHLYGLREGVDSSDEAGVLIKHWLYKQDEKFKRMKSEVAAYEKFEQLEDKLAKSNKREPLSQEVKMLVWKRDEGKCVECGSKRKLEFDHIIPFSKGGSNTARNIQILCEKCNRSKSDNLKVLSAMLSMNWENDNLRGKPESSHL